MRWLTRGFRKKLDRDLDDELRFHIETHAHELVDEGVAPDEARRRALAAFGGTAPIKELTRDALGGRWLADVVADIRHMFRAMRRHKGFTATALLSLAIGIGGNTAVFSVLNALLLRPLPVAEPFRVYFVSRTRPAAPGRSTTVTTRFSYPAFERYRAALVSQHTSLAAMSSTTRMQFTAGPSGSADAELVTGQVVSGDWFTVLGVSPAAGRLFATTDDVIAGDHPVAVISDGFWKRRFGGDRSTIGSPIHLNGALFTIVGVTAPRFEGFIVGEPVDVWVPASMQQAVRYGSNADDDGRTDRSKPWTTQEHLSWLTLVARVERAGEPGSAAAVVESIFKRELEARVADMRNAEQRAYAVRESATLIPGALGLSDIREQFGTAVIVLMTTVALVLLVACANLAHLLMARNAARTRELAVRLALGAGRGRLARQLLTESLTLAMLAGAASLFVAALARRGLLILAAGDSTPLPLDVSFDLRVVGFAVGLSVLTGVLFGVLPALRFSRPDVGDALKSGGRVVAPGLGSRLPLGRALLIVQVALSLVLVAGAALFVRTLRDLLDTDPGFQAAHVVSARFDPMMAGYAAPALPVLRARLLSSAREIPGAQSAAVAMCGTMANCGVFSGISIPGGPAFVGDDRQVQQDYVDAGYFSTLGMTFVAGRSFETADAETAELVAVVNEAMARHFFGDANPVGRVFDRGGGKYRVIGVVRDSLINGLRGVPPRMAFYPYSQHPDGPVRNLYVRTAADRETAGGHLRAAIRTVDRGIAVREVVTLEELADRSVARERLVSALTGVFGLLAVAVAGLGLYGSVSYSVARRTSEIGVRLALGASPAHVRWIVVREALVLIAAGTCIGLALTLASVDVIASLLHGVSPRDPATLAMAAAAIVLIGTFAAALPARRASHLDPLTALRLE